ncbi:FAD/NAD(P)-binding protein [Hymenobacter saemangeumensis]|uniref:FAD/NAD(P)-binding protein n=1 Tax=Hymenobacter saemangeumensis TaxID=1084522 RepID=UPI0031EE77D9
MTPSSLRPVITIVGGGFAGSALAVQLYRQPGLSGADIHLIEPREKPGPGLAYTARRPEYLLNVRPGALSFYHEQPAHFLHWLQQQPEARQGLPDFASRATYGRYLAEEVAAVLAAPSPSGNRVHWHHSKALAASPLPTGLRAVELASGEVIASHYVVLALGNFPPPPPAGPDLAYLEHPGYHADPWAAGNLRRIGAHDSVLLIGSGLTAVDVLLALRQDGHEAPVTVVAGHGRWPAAHGKPGPAYPSFYAELAGETTVSGVLRTVRRHMREAAAQGLDWRPVLDSLRPHLGHIWAAWPLAEQRLFLRHWAGIWSAARHRSPPENAAALAALTRTGKVRLTLGRVSEIKPFGNHLEVRIKPGNRPGTWYPMQHVVCCAGPLLDYSRIQEPLVQQLREAGELTPDPLRLGMLTDEHGALLSRQGHASAQLFTLGASRRPAYFESTAVPELRQQAAALARELTQRMSKTA